MGYLYDPKKRGTRSSEEIRAEALERFNAEPICKRLVQFVRQEKPYFQNTVWFDDLWDIHLVLPRKSNSRIIAQSGAFLLFGLMNEFSATFASNVRTHVIDINAESKRAILEALNAIGVDENVVFPEPERVAANIRKRYS